MYMMAIGGEFVWNTSTLLTVFSLQRRHYGRESVSNHQPLECLLSRLIKRKSKKTSKLRVTDLSAGELIGDRWIPRTKGQLHGKCFHLMTS